MAFCPSMNYKKKWGKWCNNKNTEEVQQHLQHTILFIILYRWSSFTAWTVDLACKSGIVNNVTIIISDWKKIPPNKNMLNNPKCQHSCVPKTGLILFENYSKMSHFSFSSFIFSDYYWPIKSDLSGNTVWPKALGFS